MQFGIPAGLNWLGPSEHQPTLACLVLIKGFLVTALLVHPALNRSNRESHLQNPWINMPFGQTHFPIRSLANTALSSFFKEIVVLGSENVPEEGPLIVACSHANMAIDVSTCVSNSP